MSKFTPGKWHLHPSGKANILGEFTVFYGSGETASNQICQAKKDDAKLIAASPEMYDLIKDFLGGWEYIRQVHGDLYGVGWDRCQDKANELLKKIDGDS